MNATRTSARPALRWLLALLAGGTAALMFASTASAVDNTLVASTPAADSTVDVGPTTISLQFANPLGTTNAVTMTCGAEGADASPVALGSPALLADQVTLSVAVQGTVGKGVCNVLWQVTDSSLQPAGSGTFSFTVANDPAVTTTAATTTTVAGTVDTGVTTTVATTSAPSTGDDSATASDSESSGTGGPLGLFRWFTYMGLAVLLGSVVVIAVAWPEGVEYILTVRFLRTAWLLTLASTVLYAAALSADISGDSLASSLMPTGWGSLLDTTPGKAALMCVVFTAACAYAVLRPERVIDPSTQLMALAPVVLAVVTLAFGRDGYGFVDWVAGAVHSLAMAVWFGGLVLLTRVVLAGPGDEDLVHAVRGFSKLSTPAMWLTVLSGAVLMFQLDRGGLGSSHGLVVIVKVLLVSLMVFVAVAARQFIAQRASRATVMTLPLATRLRRALGMEALIGVIVLALTSWTLALTPPGLEASASSGTGDLPAAHEFVNDAIPADVTVAFSEVVGVNEVRIEVIQPAENLSGLTVEFLPPPGSTVPGMVIGPIGLTGAGVAVMPASAGFTLGTAGTWTVIVRINGDEVSRTDVFVGDASDTATSGG